MSSKGLVAIVTGASSGIGEATAERLAGAGYKVYGTSRRSAQGQSGKRTFEMVALDVTSDESVVTAVNEVLRLEGRIDLLVNNAGFGVAPAAAEESSIQQAQAIFNTNFFGIVRMIRAVLPHMRQRGSGRIINISSVLGFVPMPYMALYSATKHAVEGYSESLDQELRTQGIRVSLVEPAYIKSAFEANQLQPDEALKEYRDLRAGLDLRVKEALEGADGPAVVAETVVKVALAATPKVRYTSGALAGRLRFLRRFAPASLVDAGVRKDLRLDSQPAVRRRATAP
jgi:NAD(P)-dependent dehydrogenase (short-subunit alcohol dehydrogenase family)